MVKVITDKISQRDKYRAGEKYRKTLRGYQLRKDILDAMFYAIDVKSLPKDKRILMMDVGCGPGIVGDYVYRKIKIEHRLSPLMIFVDINEKMLKAVPKKFDYITVKNDITNLQFPDNFFDVVVMKQVLHYLPKFLKIKALKEVHRVLKNKGQFVFSVLVSVDDDSNRLVNELYTKREEIIAQQVAMKKYIPTRKTLFEWLQKAGFKQKEEVYLYDIPLTALDYQESFGLNKLQTNKLNELYRKIFNKDIKKAYRGRIITKGKYTGYAELIDKGLIVKCVKE